MGLLLDSSVDSLSLSMPPPPPLSLYIPLFSPPSPLSPSPSHSLKPFSITVVTSDSMGKRLSSLRVGIRVGLLLDSASLSPPPPSPLLLPPTPSHSLKPFSIAFQTSTSLGKRLSSLRVISRVGLLLDFAITFLPVSLFYLLSVSVPLSFHHSLPLPPSPPPPIPLRQPSLTLSNHSPSYSRRAPAWARDCRHCGWAAGWDCCWTLPAAFTCTWMGRIRASPPGTFPDPATPFSTSAMTSRWYARKRGDENSVGHCCGGSVWRER